jgi:hypothetical protein
MGVKHGLNANRKNGLSVCENKVLRIYGEKKWQENGEKCFKYYGGKMKGNEINWTRIEEICIENVRRQSGRDVTRGGGLRRETGMMMKRILQKELVGGAHGLDSSGAGYSPVASPCKDGNEPSGFIKHV